MTIAGVEIPDQIEVVRNEAGDWKLTARDAAGHKLGAVVPAGSTQLAVREVLSWFRGRAVADNPAGVGAPPAAPSPSC